MHFRLPLFAGAFLALITAALNAAELHPFVIPAQISAGSFPDLSAWNPKPAGDDGYVSIDADGHLQVGGKRLRLFGINLLLTDAFPSKALADRHSARLARFGFNAVRLHYLDTKYDRSIILSKQNDTRQIDRTNLDRLHYYVAQLAAKGIYSDVNLLNTRSFLPGDGLGDDIPGLYFTDQHSLAIFDETMIALQKEYATGFLTVPNPYRGNQSLAQDPSVAIIEILNENGLLWAWGRGFLSRMPQRYQEKLKALWTHWLEERYGSTDTMYTAWQSVSEPLGANLLTNGDFASGKTGWTVWFGNGATGSSTVTADYNGAPALRIDVATATINDAQITRTNLPLQAGKIYTLGFWTRCSDADAANKVILCANYAPWSRFSEPVSFSGTEWKYYEHTFKMPVDEPKNLLAFTVGNPSSTVWIADVTFRTGGDYGILPTGESFANRNISIVPYGDKHSPPEKYRDWIRFLQDAESTYWSSMRDHVRSLGFKGVIVGTTVRTSSPNIQAALDATDTHSYWQQPALTEEFLNGTDRTAWTIAHKAMVNFPEQSRPEKISSLQVKGRPNFVTEYQHPAPNRYANDAPIITPAYTALQDIDGFWFHSYQTLDSYCLTDQWDHSGSMSKLANTILAAALFRRDVEPANKEYVLPMSPATEVESIATHDNIQESSTAFQIGMPPTLGLVSRTKISIGENATGLTTPPAKPTGPIYTSDTNQLRWDVTNPEAGTVTINTAKTKAFVGFGSGVRSELGGVSITTGTTRLNWCTIGITLLEGNAFDDNAGGRALIVTTGDYANTDWVWKDSTQTSLTSWGGAPFLIEIIPGEIELPVAASRVKAWALSGEGTRLDELPITAKSGRTVITLGTVGNTLWYEVQISAAPVPPPAPPAPEPTTSANSGGGGGGAMGSGYLLALISLSLFRSISVVRRKRCIASNARSR